MKNGDKFKLLKDGRDMTRGKIYEIAYVVTHHNKSKQIYFDDDVGDSSWVWDHEIFLIFTPIQDFEYRLKNAIIDRDIGNIEHFAKELVNAITQEQSEPYDNPQQGDVNYR